MLYCGLYHDILVTSDYSHRGFQRPSFQETILQKFKERLEGKEVPKDAKEVKHSEREQFQPTKAEIRICWW